MLTFIDVQKVIVVLCLQNWYCLVRLVFLSLFVFLIHIAATEHQFYLVQFGNETGPLLFAFAMHVTYDIT